MHTYEFKAQAQGQFGDAGGGLGFSIGGLIKDAASTVANAAVTTTAAVMTGGASLVYQASTGTLTRPIDAAKMAFTDVCKLTSSPAMQTAAAAGAAVPNGYSQGAATGVQSVNTACALINGQPAPAQPTAQTVASRVMTFKLPYPVGSIAYIAKNGVYHIAKPIGTLNGLDGPTYIETAKSATPPVGVTVVSKSTYQKATLPWYRRTNVMIGIFAGAAVAGTGAYYYRKHR